MSNTKDIPGDPKASDQGGSSDGLPRLVRRSVFSEKNSACPSARIKDLNPERGWWTDDSMDSLYLHVWHKDGETVHRVYCRKSEKPRLIMNRGRLMWIYSTNDLASQADDGGGRRKTSR